MIDDTGTTSNPHEVLGSNILCPILSGQVKKLIPRLFGLVSHIRHMIFATEELFSVNARTAVNLLFTDANKTFVFLKEHPQLIQLIKLSIEKSVNEWISPVIERAIKIAVTTCEQIVKKVDTAFCKVNLGPHMKGYRIALHHVLGCTG